MFLVFFLAWLLTFAVRLTRTSTASAASATPNASATPKGHGMGPDGATAACTDGTQIYDPNPRTDNACAAHGGFAKVYG